MNSGWLNRVFLATTLGVFVATAPACAQDTPAPKPVSEEELQKQQKQAEETAWKALSAELEGARALNPQGTVLIQLQQKRVLLKTKVVCPDCILEMVLVPEGNREHETILSIRSQAFVIHAALLGIGLEPGKPAAFSPEFVAPSGPIIQIEAVWQDASGQVRRRPLKEWVRFNTQRYHSQAMPAPPTGVTLPHGNLRWDRFNNEILWFGPMTEAERDDLLSLSDDAVYQQAIRRFHKAGLSRPLTADFVFAGSSIYKDEETGQEFYEAEGGHLICTSNFPDALLDLREESSAADGAQSYEGWTERIPPENTPVLLILSEGRKEKTASAPEKPMPSEKSDSTTDSQR